MKPKILRITNLLRPHWKAMTMALVAGTTCGALSVATSTVARRTQANGLQLFQCRDAVDHDPDITIDLGR